MSVRPKQLSRMGEFYLVEAVLDVLCDAYSEGYGLGPKEISERAGIYRDKGPSMGMHDAIVAGLLNLLHHQQRVERIEQSSGRGGWRLTEVEYNLRRDNMDFG